MAATVSLVMADATGAALAAASCGAGLDWPALLAVHERWLRRVVAARVGTSHAVDEVMQEVAMAVVRQDSRPRDAQPGDDQSLDASRAPAWLYRVAVRQALLYRRADARRRRREGVAAGMTGARADGAAAGAATRAGRRNEDDPLHWLLNAERRELVRSAIAKLPQRDADVLILKYSERWSYKRLAEHLGLSEKAVESRLHRARTRLRDELAKLDITGDET